MTIINISEAKATLSKIIAAVEKGEEFIIGRAGKPIAKLSALKRKPFPRVFKNEWKGKVKSSKDFDKML